MGCDWTSGAAVIVSEDLRGLAWCKGSCVWVLVGVAGGRTRGQQL